MNAKYTEEFKREAVKMALESPESNVKIAGNLGVKYKTMMNWINKNMSQPPKDVKPVDYKSRYQSLVVVKP